MAWIELHDTLPDHHKVIEVADALKLDKDAVVGKLIRLWTWALNNREDGRFRARDTGTVAEVMRYKGKPQRLIDAMVSARLLDEEDGGYVIHDWDERVGLLLAKREEKRAQTRERVRRHRERRMEGLYCAYCGDKATGYDHIIPISKGGTDNEDNVVPCCSDCNNEKNNRPLDDFLNTSRKARKETVESNEKIMRHVSLCNGCYTLSPVTRYTAHNVTQSNAATVPKPYQDNIDDDEDISARARVREEEREAAIREKEPLVTAAFKGAFGREPNRQELNGISSMFANAPPELVHEAIERAADYGASAPLKYIRAIRATWKDNGVNSLQALWEYEARREAMRA